VLRSAVLVLEKQKFGVGAKIEEEKLSVESK
jgi:hypothetical protein